ncbi:sulfite reductase, subunit B [Treponema primitia ZAS-2]|uniref:Sulfite reductase, subunit B n=1 Tax=Treponema primitia (strain ATCC BAA-887 / DSM 12427 / ZAS-2) TaxID=545694 RepID=F5YMW5_TREPZ|nr:anaerobic sulfite reductase subunit AsrB [Treponema primitia]AEF84586.1 sulfite reductase, subunit B [Treponema primitia ZAS-2]
MEENNYLPFRSEVIDIIRHTKLEYTFKMAYNGAVLPGQFFEVSIPGFGEAPISVSGIDSGSVDLTIRRVGNVTGELFTRRPGGALFMRGPYGNGFAVGDYAGRELVVIAGGTGVSPVRGVITHFASQNSDAKKLTVIAGFKTPEDILFRKDFEAWKKRAAVILTVDKDEGNGGYPVGLVTEYIPKLDIQDLNTAAAIVVGPPPMMRFSTKGLIERGFKESNIWISQERRMCCGIGKCGHCKVNEVYICLDGPVFNFSRGRHLID